MIDEMITNPVLRRRKIPLRQQNLTTDRRQMPRDLWDVYTTRERVSLFSGVRRADGWEFQRYASGRELASDTTNRMQARLRLARCWHLRRDALRQGPPFHGRLVLHVLDLLLQCVLVHGGEYTGIHGYSRTPLVAAAGEIARAPLRGKSIGRREYIGCSL